MKQFIGAGLMILVAVGYAAAQESKLYSNPALPSREVLERLNLRMAWHVNVPMDGRRDRFVSIQLNAGQVVAATRTGVVAAYDAETGREQWKVGVGKPGDATYSPTFNSRSVLVVRGVQLYALDRATGRLQWQYRLPFGIASAPVADERQIYLSGINSQVAAFALPSPGDLATPVLTPGERIEEATELRYQKERDSLSLREIHPDEIWSANTNLRLDYAPTMTRDAIFYATPGGHLFAYSKYPLTSDAVEVYRFQLDNRLTAPPGIYDEMAYIATSDTSLSAISIPSGKSLWRHAAGNSIIRQPFATDTDIYITVERKGLVRLKRETGAPMWKLPLGRTTTEAVAEADQVLAVNNKFVYATDTAGRLRVLDRATGKQLSYYEPFRDFNYPVYNETTDRLLLAANNGLIVCLHDREYEKPLVYRTFDLGKNAPEILVKKLKDKLARKVSDKGADALPLADVLDSFRRKYSIDIFLSDKAFADAGIQSIKDKPVTQPRVDNMEVGEVLKGILAKVDASYAIVGDTIHVLPKTAVAVNPMNPMIPMNPMENVNPPANIDPAVRKFLGTKTDPIGVDKESVGEFLEATSLRYDVKFKIDEAAFKALGVSVEELQKKEFMYPKGKGIPASELLREVFDQVKGAFEVRGDTIFLIPKK